MNRRIYFRAFVVLFSVSIGNFAAAQTASPPIRDSIRSFARPVVSWTAIRNQSIVMQKRDYSCGAASLATVLRYYWGKDISENDVLESLARSLRPEALQERTENGLTMADLKVVSDRMGYDAAVGKLESLDKLRESRIPVIVTIKIDGTNHFVVFRGAIYGWVYLADPIRGNVRISELEFEKQWVENAIFVVTLPGKTSSAVSRLGIRPEEVLSARLNRQVTLKQLSGTAR